MAFWGTLHAAPIPLNPRNRKVMSLTQLATYYITATAALAGISISIPPGFKFGETNKQPQFLSKFPLGNVPAFETNDGFNLSESYAIVYYIAECAPNPAVTKQLVGSTPEQRALIQQWIFFTCLHLDPTIGKLCAWRKDLSGYDEQVERVSSDDIKRWLDYMETSIKGKKWFVMVGKGIGPSLADVVMGSIMYLAFAAYMDESLRAEYVEVTRWYERLMEVKEFNGLFNVEMVQKRVN